MCRHLAYLGSPAPLASLVTEPPHSLVVQSYACRELLRGSVCADGFGVGWYPDGDPLPAVYRREQPIWADTDLGSVCRAVRSGCFVGSVRNATIGIPWGPASVQPMPHQGHLFCHNGGILDFASHVRELRGRLPDDLFRVVKGGSDTETLFMLVLTRVREAGGHLVAGLRAALREVQELSPGSGLNTLLPDGRTLVASRYAGEAPNDSLYLLTGGQRLPGGTVVASERLDQDPGWQPVPANTLVVLRPGEAPGLTAVAA